MCSSGTVPDAFAGPHYFVCFYSDTLILLINGRVNYFANAPLSSCKEAETPAAARKTSTNPFKNVTLMINYRCAEKERQKMQSLSIAMQNYLETIFDLSQQNKPAGHASAPQGGVRVSDIATHLDVSKASVNNAMNVLAKLGYVSNEKYQEIFLTDLGRETAAILESKHIIIKTLFTDIVGIAEDTADDDACAIEHIISHEAVQQIHEYLVSQGIDVIGS